MRLRSQVARALTPTSLILLWLSSREVRCATRKELERVLHPRGPISLLSSCWEIYSG